MKPYLLTSYVAIIGAIICVLMWIGHTTKVLDWPAQMFIMIYSAELAMICFWLVETIIEIKKLIIKLKRKWKTK